LDTNIWLDYIERKAGAEKSKKLLQILTDVRSQHKIILPKILYLEIMYKLIDTRKENYLITHEGYSSMDLKSSNGKKIKFKIKLPEKEMRKIEEILLDLKNSDKIEIVSNNLDFGRVEILVKQGFELLDSMIIVQVSDGKADYFVTRDKIVRRINETNIDWIKLKAVTINGMMSLLGH
jgi:predicted nucleic acid-binding protein